MRIWIFCAFLVASCTRNQSEEARVTFSGDRALRHIETQLSFGPRYPGSEGHARTQEWISTELTALGWLVEKQSFEYQGETLVNIVAEKREASDGSTLLLGAHYDTRLLADQDPHFPNQPVPGANDGASGVAVLLELARVFADTSPLNMMLVFFDAEDQGRINGWDWAIGARVFVTQLNQDLEAVVIIDMVGDHDLKLPIEATSDPDLVEEIWSTADELGFSAFEREAGPTMIDDHTPFLQAGYPTVLIIDFTYPFWHTTGDQLDKVSAKSLSEVGLTLETWLTRQADP